jgi:hypothetical protein
MASTAQQQAFAGTYGPLAQAAGASLGVDPNLIYSQWALESGWGTNSLSQGYNVGSIMPGGVGASYASPQAFEQSYVGLIQSNFPNAVNTGANAGAFVQGLQLGRSGSYFGSQSAPSYLSSLTSISGSNPLGTAATASSAGAGAPVTAAGGTPAVAGGATGTASSIGGGSMIGGVWEIVQRSLVVIIGLVLLFAGLLALAWQSKTVQTQISNVSQFAKVPI